jgi:hypothetical protein
VEAASLNRDVPVGGRTPLVALGILVVLVAPAAALGTTRAIPFLAVLAIGAWALAIRGWLTQWRIMIAGIVLLILLVPIRRYTLPGSLPFQLEPYRVAVGILLVVWAASALVQPELRWRKSGLFGPVGCLVIALVLSVSLNVGRIDALNVRPEVLKELTFFGSFIAVMLIVTNVLRSRRDIDTVVKALVGGGAIVGLATIVQYRTAFNVFDHLQRVIPILEFHGGPEGLQARGSGTRVYASAQHPIALSAALVILIPLGTYLGQSTRQKRWWIATGLIVIAALSTIARTGMTMLVAELFVLICLKPRQMLKLWPYVGPFLVIVHFAAPGALGGIHSAFTPKEGLVAQQTTNAGETGSGRVADLGPSLEEASRTLFFGQGFGSRISTPTNPKVNALILDDQWLGSLLETGLAGVLSLLWLFSRSVRRLGHAARRDHSPYGWLLAGLAAAITAYGIGMITYDAFAFTQVTFLLFIMLGLGIAAARVYAPSPWDAPASARG